MVNLIQPRDQGELGFIKSLLDANGIRYFVQNEHFGSLYPGLPAVSCMVMVHEADLDRAATLIRELHASRKPERLGKLRAIPREPTSRA